MNETLLTIDTKQKNVFNHLLYKDDIKYFANDKNDLKDILKMMT